MPANGAGLAAHKRGDVRLLDPEDFTSLCLGKAACFDQPVDLERQARFQKLLLRMGQVEIGKDVAAAFFKRNPVFPLHGQFCLSL